MKNMFCGKIYRDGTQTLKKCGIGQNSHILCELLPAEVEHYPESQVLLYMRKRIIKDATYEHMKMEFVELPGPYPTHAELLKACAKIYGLDPATTSIAKYIPHRFCWQKILPPAAEDQTKNRRKKKGKAADDLRQAPYFFRESGK